MNKNKSTLSNRFKYLLLGAGLIIGISSGLVSCGGQQVKKEVKPDTVMRVDTETPEQKAKREALLKDIVENGEALVKATFPGGGDEALKAQIIKNIEFKDPKKAKTYKGEIPIRYMVKKDGVLGQFTLMKTIDGDCDMALIKAMGKIRGTKFTPAQNKEGRIVAAWDTITIQFPIVK